VKVSATNCKVFSGLTIRAKMTGGWLLLPGILGQSESCWREIAAFRSIFARSEKNFN